MGVDAATDFDPGPPPGGDLEVALTEDQIETFHRDGFVAVGRVTTDEELDWLREVFDHLFSRKVGGFPGGYFDLSRPYNSEGDDHVPQVLHPSTRVPRLRETLLHRNGRRIAEQLLGVAPDESDERVTAWDHMIFKPARHGSELPWHQDEAYWETGFRYSALGCWVPLDDATLDNGCLHFVPGSHRGRVLPHRHIGGDPSVHGLELDPAADPVDTSSGRAVELAAGEATAHHCRTLHHSGPNRTEGVRRAYATEYQLRPEPCDDDEPRPWVRAGLEEWKKAVTEARRGDQTTSHGS